MLNRNQALALLAVLLLAVCCTVLVHAGTTGIIAGVVKSVENGTPVSGANVIISGTTLSTVTDSQGNFVITNVPPGDYTVRVEMVGFAVERIASVQVAMDEKAELKLDLTPEATKETTVVVTRPRPMVTAEVTNTLNLVNAPQEPLTRQDPASIRQAPGMLSAFPGVTVEPSGSGQMHIRGGRADQIGWYVEGMPITDPNTGMFGTNLFTTGLGRFQVYTGGFGAEYGNAISGVLNEVKKTGADSPGVRLNLEGGSASYRDAFGEFGGGSADQFNYYIGAAVQSTALDGPVLTHSEYTDSVAKLVWPSKNNTFTVLAMQGNLIGNPDTYHDSGDNGEATPHEKDYMRQRYSVTSLTWNHSFSPKSFVIVRPYYQVTDIFQNLVGKYGVVGRISSTRGGLQVNYTNQLNDKHLLKLGGSILHSDNNYYVFPGFPYYSSNVNTSQSDLYIQDRVKLADKWNLEAGIRNERISYSLLGNDYVTGEGYTGSALSDPSESVTTPRAGLSFSPDSRTVWKFSYGKYAKFVPASSVQKVYFDPDMDLGGIGLYTAMPGLGSAAPQTSIETELSLEKQISDTTMYRITPFISTYENLGDSYMDPNSGITTYSNLGEGRSSGMEFLVRRKMADGWQGWLSYTYQKTKANRADLGLTSGRYYTSWDQTHTLSAVVDRKSGRFNHSVRADFGSGRTDIGDPSYAGRANPALVLSYNLAMQLPKDTGLGDTVYLSVFNLLGNHQTQQFRWDDPSTRVRDSWVPERFISLGFSQQF